MYIYIYLQMSVKKNIYIYIYIYRHLARKTIPDLRTTVGISGDSRVKFFSTKMHWFSRLQKTRIKARFLVVAH